MPSGNIHTIITIAASTGLYLLAPVSDPQRIAITAGCLAGLIISPDLDVDMQTSAHSTVRRTLGRLPGLAWRLLWLPYAYLVPHRSWISHAPLISTLIRAGYLYGLAWGIAYLVQHPLPAMPWWLPWAVGGLTVADTLHWLADGVL